MKSIYGDSPDIWGTDLVLGADAGSAGAPTRAAATAKEAYWRAIRAVSGIIGWRPIGYHDDGAADRILYLGGHPSDAYAADECRVYLSSTYDGLPKLAYLLAIGTLTLGHYNYGGGATNQFVATATKIGTNLGSDPLIIQLGAPTGNADGASFIVRNHRDGGSSGSASRTASLVDTFELDKNGYAIIRPGTADKRVMLQGTLKALCNEAVACSGTSETDLASCSITAGLLKVKGDAIRFTCSIDCAANANNKQVRIKLGSTTLADTGAIAANGGRLNLNLTVFRTNSSIVQSWEANIVGHPSLVASPAQGGTSAEDTATTLTLKVTGQGGASSDLVLANARWEYLPANSFNASL